ncbi:MAG: FAD-dependent oxidoreductase [Gemmatimonadaceae bacterium]
MTDFSAEQFDLLVIGGGITGCGVARDAAMRGLSVALVERDDFASGTSGRSSRLIHGGIRYLEQRQFHLVYESIRERQILLRIAPHLVEPLAFTWPIYRGARVGKLKLGAALFIYEFMAGGRTRRHESLDASETLAREPGLESAGLAGGAVYYDARTDDSRLTVANAVAAAHAGATVLTHTSVTEVLRAGGKSIGALTRAQFSGEQREIRARVIVNSTGVWQNSFNDGSGGRRHRGSKGTHISIPRERIANRDALTLISPVDGRVMFCLPAGTQTIIGTTDTWTDESPESVHASSSEVDYLLNAANHYFPRANLTSDDVTSAWAGIRPLAFASTTHPSRASREHSIVSDRFGVIHVTGGKLTTYRSMAAEVVDRAQNALGRRKQRAPTDSVELPGADRSDEIAKLQRDDPALSQPLAKGLQYTAAHLVYAVRNEMAQTLSDLLIRRTHLAFETRDHGKSAAPLAADVVGPLLGWSEQTKATRIREFDEDTERMFSIGN